MLNIILKSVAHHFETCGTSFWNLPKSGQEQKYVKKKFISINKGIYCMANCADYKKTIMVCNGILWLELLDFLGYGTFSLMPWGINVWHGLYGISRNLYWLHLGLSQMTARALASLALTESHGKQACSAGWVYNRARARLLRGMLTPKPYYILRSYNYL